MWCTRVISSLENIRLYWQPSLRGPHHTSPHVGPRNQVPLHLLLSVVGGGHSLSGVHGREMGAVCPGHVWLGNHCLLHHVCTRVVGSLTDVWVHHYASMRWLQCTSSHIHPDPHEW